MAQDRAAMDARAGEPAEGYAPPVEPVGPAVGAASAHVVGADEVRAQSDTDDDTPPEQHPFGEPPETLTMPATQVPGGTTDVSAASLRENMLVLGADGDTLGTVDGPDADNTVRLKPDTLGQAHWLPLDWIARVDDQAHLDRPTAQARQEWLAEVPAP
jgi:hypothetical protein